MIDMAGNKDAPLRLDIHRNAVALAANTIHQEIISLGSLGTFDEMMGKARYSRPQVRITPIRRQT